MTRIDWWLGILLVVSGLLWVGLLPRYSFATIPVQDGIVVRMDRWTGQVEWSSGLRPGAWGRWANQARDPLRR